MVNHPRDMAGESDGNLMACSFARAIQGSRSTSIVIDGSEQSTYGCSESHPCESSKILQIPPTNAQLAACRPSIHPRRMLIARSTATMLAGSLSHRLTPEGCGRGKYRTPSPIAAVPTTSESDLNGPRNVRIASEPTSRTISGSRTSISSSSQGRQRPCSSGVGSRSPRAGDPAGIAAGDRGEVDSRVELVARDAAFLEPGPELVAGDPREGTVLDRRAQARGLADEQDPRRGDMRLGIAGDRHRVALVEMAGQVAPPAGAEAGVEGDDAGASNGIRRS